MRVLDGTNFPSTCSWLAATNPFEPPFSTKSAFQTQTTRERCLIFDNGAEMEGGGWERHRGARVWVLVGRESVLAQEQAQRAQSHPLQSNGGHTQTLHMCTLWHMDGRGEVCVGTCRRKK